MWILLPNEHELQSIAWSIIDELGLVEMLRKYGETKIVGSVALNLIVKPDIDIHVLVEEADILEVSNQILPELFSRDKINEVRVTDYRDTSDGIKLGIDGYPDASGPWDIDIWITNNVETTGFEHVKLFNEQLSEKQREIILEIKRHYYGRGLLRDGISTRI